MHFTEELGYEIEVFIEDKNLLLNKTLMRKTNNISWFWILKKKKKKAGSGNYFGEDYIND